MKTTHLVAFCFLLLCSCAANTLQAQGWSSANLDDLSRWEIGAAGGGALYFGDLTPSKRDYFSEATPVGGALVRYYLGHDFSLRGNLNIAQLSGDDSKYNTPDWKQYRNFSFTTTLYEFVAVLEYDLLRTNHHDLVNNKWGVSVFAGLGLCYTNTRRNLSHVDVGYFGNMDKAVSGLSEEMNSDPNHLALVAPVGLTVSYDVTHRVSLFAEGSVRHGFDDKIDGFSKAVSSGKNDAYSFFLLGVTLRFNRRGWWG